MLGWILGIVPPPSGIIALPQWPKDLLGQAFQGLSQINKTNIWNLITVTFVFLFIDLFDTIGTLAGVGTQAGYIDENGELPHATTLVKR